MFQSKNKKILLYISKGVNKLYNEMNLSHFFFLPSSANEAKIQDEILTEY